MSVCSFTHSLLFHDLIIRLLPSGLSVWRQRRSRKKTSGSTGTNILGQGTTEVIFQSSSSRRCHKVCPAEILSAARCHWHPAYSRFAFEGLLELLLDVVNKVEEKKNLPITRHEKEDNKQDGKVQNNVLGKFADSPNWPSGGTIRNGNRKAIIKNSC